MKETANRAFEEMRKVALIRLSNRNPEEIAEKAGILYRREDSSFLIPSLGQTLELSWPECVFWPPVEGWQHLILLHYLDLADGTPLSGRWINFGSLKEGVIRGTKFDRDAERDLAAFLKGKNPEEVRAALRELGAEEIKSPAGRPDLCVRIPLLPYYPVILNIWFADEEFPASGKMLLNGSADHYLTVEDAVIAGTLVLELLQPAALRREI